MDVDECRMRAITVTTDDVPFIFVFPLLSNGIAMLTVFNTSRAVIDRENYRQKTYLT